jgi:hypothetical protein
MKTLGAQNLDFQALKTKVSTSAICGSCRLLLTSSLIDLNAASLLLFLILTFGDDIGFHNQVVHVARSRPMFQIHEQARM